jgi:hypothetical protein
MPEPSKACTKCCVVKPLAEFSFDQRRPGGLQSQCRQCTRERQKTWKAENREHYLALRRAEGKRLYKPKVRKTSEERFWSKVDKHGPLSGYAPHLGPCWLWTASKMQYGYGAFNFGPRIGRAHVFAYTVLVGPIPDGLELDHLCRVPGCVNPSHLEPVTHRENCLRGTSIVAVYAQRTHCKNGHEFTSDNTGRGRGNSRRCLACHRESERERNLLKGTK